MERTKPWRGPFRDQVLHGGVARHGLQIIDHANPARVSQAGQSGQDQGQSRREQRLERFRSRLFRGYKKDSPEFLSEPNAEQQETDDERAMAVNPYGYAQRENGQPGRPRPPAIRVDGQQEQRAQRKGDDLRPHVGRPGGAGTKENKERLWSTTRPWFVV